MRSEETLTSIFLEWLKVLYTFFFPKPESFNLQAFAKAEDKAFSKSFNAMYNALMPPVRDDIY